MLGGSLHDLDPDRARLGASHPGDRVDRDAPQAVRLQQHGAHKVAERRRVVSRSLRCDPEPLFARPVHDLDDVVEVLGDRDRGGPLVDGQVPGQAGLVPARVAGKDELSDEIRPHVPNPGRTNLGHLQHAFHRTASRSASWCRTERATRRVCANRPRGRFASLHATTFASSAGT